MLTAGNTAAAGIHGFNKPENKMHEPFVARVNDNRTSGNGS